MHHNTRRALQRKIFAWYAHYGRHDLPWRQGDSTLYGVVVAEVMLQQTNVPKVVSKYQIFLQTFPSWQALAGVPQSAVMCAWRGLGYNRRAINLHRCAKIIVDHYDGIVPNDPGQLRALPGIGPYTAHAICAFGYNADCAAVDVNIARLLQRWGMREPLQVAAEMLLPAGQSHQWHSALMDFASMVCTKRAPQCITCPLRKICPSYPLSHLDDAYNDNVVKVKREPGRMERGRYIPRRIYRGRIVEALRSQPLDTKQIGQIIKSDWSVMRDRVWLEEILNSLDRDSFIIRNGGKWHIR